MNRLALAIVLLALAAPGAAVQQPFGAGPYDPAVPTPRSVLLPLFANAVFLGPSM